MSWKNLGPGTMYLPSGKTVKMGDTFTEKQAEGVNTRALERGQWIKKVERATTEKKKK